MNNYINLQKNEALVHALSHDGRGIATIGNITTFIAGALPQEKVIYKITKKSQQYHEAEALEIREASKERACPPCRHFGICGGCSLQHIKIESQLALKQRTLLEHLTHFGHVKPESILPPLHASSIGYRRKARLGVKFVVKKNKVLIGFREKKSRYLADLAHCEVLHPCIGSKLTELGQLVASLLLYQHIPQIEIAMGDSEIALVFRVLAPLPEADKDKLVTFGQCNGFHIYLQPNPPLPLIKLWPQDDNQRLSYTLPDYQLEFLFHPLDFTQINLEINRQMVKQAIHLLDLKRNETVLDLFCGIGNFTLPLSLHAAHVTGVEGGAEMVQRGQENAIHNHINNVDYHVANLAKPASTASWRMGSYDKILLDPPRVGAKEILPFLPKLNPRKIVYISCNPATLARDAGELVNQYHYHLKEVGIMNMFPHTSHIEAMAVFDKA